MVSCEGECRIGEPQCIYAGIQLYVFTVGNLFVIDEPIYIDGSSNITKCIRCAVLILFKKNPIFYSYSPRTIINSSVSP